MTIEAEWIEEVDGAVVPSPSTEIVPLRGSGAELVVRPEGALARLAATPTAARTMGAARSLAEHTAKAARASSRAVATALVTAPAPRVGRAVGRFVSGRPLVGGPRTDATFWRGGRRQPLEIPGESSKWSYAPGYRRAAVRLGGCTIGGSLAYLFWPGAVTLLGCVLAGLAVLWGAYGARRAAQTHGHRTRYLRPLHDALRGSVGQTATRPEEWIHVPADFKSNPGADLRIDLPAAYDGSDGVANHVKTVVRNKLGLASDAAFTFHVEGNKPYVVFREPVRPPTKVTYADVLALITKAKETAPIIGLAAGNKPITVDLEADSPHVLVSAGSGAGKSVLLRTILSQGLAKGGYGIIFDVKKVSHMWANNLRNCEYHRTAEAIHDRLISLRNEVDRRNDLVERYADIDGNTDHVDVGPRIWVLAEEMNATINRLNKYWREIKEKGEPNTSPAVEALLDLLFMGRQIKIHVVSVAQMASARTMGGPEARENYATRCLSRYTMNAWRMLCPEVWPMPKKPRQLGRWQIVTAGQATETQVAFFTPREARDLAQLGVSSNFRDDFIAGAVAPSHVSQDRPDLGHPPETVPETGPVESLPADSQESLPVVDAARLVGLREAVDEDLVEGMSLANLRKATQRDMHFPPVAGKRGPEKLYDAEALGKWARNRRLANERDNEGLASDSETDGA
ncbi:hypothetical protein [Pseudonocardia sp. H11422]|uniref:hypothetical protein n=1 Tax=Pseudonocardia sp. H11422 TaxID=2835866 RepID=UPI001BDD93CF|nr:hypothetical protein [Pseudonocardia sp. H11422]